MSDLTNDPSKLWQIIVVASAATPIIVLLIKWFWKSTHNEVKSAIISDLKEDNEVFKKLMHEQMEVVKDTVEVVKDSIIVMKKDNELSHDQNKQMIDVMMLHIEELTHIKVKVEEHEGRIYKIETKK